MQINPFALLFISFMHLIMALLRMVWKIHFQQSCLQIRLQKSIITKHNGDNQLFEHLIWPEKKCLLLQQCKEQEDLSWIHRPPGWLLCLTFRWSKSIISLQTVQIPYGNCCNSINMEPYDATFTKSLSRKDYTLQDCVVC